MSKKRAYQTEENLPGEEWVQFGFRVLKREIELLDKISQHHIRNRCSTLRWLIIQEARRLGLLE